MSSNFSYFQHEPLIREILLFLPPQFVFIVGRFVSLQWKHLIESKSFSELYFSSIIAIDKEMVVSNIGNNENNDEEMKNVYRELGKPFDLGLDSENVDNFHFRLLKSIAMHKIKQKNNPLELLFNILNESQLNQLKHLLSKLKLTNLLKSHLVVELSNSSLREMILFRDDGIPLLFDGVNVNFHTCIIWFLNLSILKMEFGIQKVELIKYLKGYLGDSIRISEMEFQILEDFLVLLHPQTRKKAAMKAIPKPERFFIEISDEQHTEYYNKIDNFIPDIDWQ